ncbi:MAG: hypothetical protein ABIO41_02145 [Ignavibacteria bacterium]
MKLNIIKLIIIIILAVLADYLNAKPKNGFSDESPWLHGSDNPLSQNSVSVIKTQKKFDANNIETWIINTGIFNQDLRDGNRPGFMWPKGSNKYAIFTSGLSIGTYYNNSLRLATASYGGEYAPGYISNGEPFTDSRFRIYSVKKGDNSGTNPDFAEWGSMVPFGAPYVDVNENNIYDAEDIPGIKDADQTMFVCLTDGFQDTHSQSEGFSGGTEPIFAEVHLTMWCYNTQGLENIQFVNWVVINKSNVNWERTHFSVVVDPDLGFENDDYIGCDTSARNKDMAFCYNADDIDGSGMSDEYGAAPPASGMDFFKSPAIFTGNANDSLILFNPPGSNNKVVKRGWRELGLTSFVYFTNNSTPGPVCEKDPSQPIEAYRYMKGFKKDGTSWLNPVTLEPTKYCYPGDPVTLSGWSERGTNQNTSQATVDNCNGALGGTVGASPPGDRRFIFNSGDSLFTVAPGDTQFIVVGQFVARGSSNLNSITNLKRVDETAQSLFNSNFSVNPPPPSPQVTASVNELSNIGTSSVTLSWDNRAESYLLLDSLLQPASDNSFLKFEGYQIFEISRFAGNLPDFNQPQTIDNSIHLLRIFDIVDTIGIIVDTLSTGISIGGQEQFAPFPVIPFYTAPVPEGFPNTGINRNIIITNTTYPDEHGGRSELIYGQTYKFAVVAYAYRTNPKTRNERKTVTSPIGSAIITVVPQAPLAGTNFSMKNGDTLFTNRRDLGVIPIIKDQQGLLNAKYRIVFQSPDTTYNVLRSFDGGNTFENIINGLRVSRGIPGAVNPDDDSRIVDGILMKTQAIYNFNAGVVRDPGKPDSSQTRIKGWEYLPQGNAYLTRSETVIGSFPYQSLSMSISYPGNLTFTGQGTTVQKESLRKIKIQYTGYGDGQKAYRYLNRSLGAAIDPSFIPFIINTGPGYRYQDLRNVPFKVFEIDEFDSNAAPRQLNCAFLENNDTLVVQRIVGGQTFTDTIGKGFVDGRWEPTIAANGGLEILYIFNSSYDTSVTEYKAKNLRLQQNQFDIMYVWNPRRINSGASFHIGDEFKIYPYTVTRPDVVEGIPLYYEFETLAPAIGNSEVAVSQNDLDKIRVVPNPFYGFNEIQSNTVSRFITFRRLPVKCTIKIFSLSGILIKKIEKENTESSIDWDLKNFNGVPVASGMFIALIEAPGIGNKTVKLAIFTAEERIDF